METTIDKYLKEDLTKTGILDKDGNLNKNISEKDYNNLINGGGLLIEKNNKAVLFSVENSKLNREVYSNDTLKHKNLSSAELLYLSFNKDANLSKTFADYGKISNFGKDHYLGDKRNEKQFFVVLENERGQSVFWGNDLEKKLQNYKVGDNVQINNVGIEKKNLEFTLNGEKESAVKYDNSFTIGKLDSNNKQYKTSLFEVNKLTNVARELDVTNLTLKSVNGQYLSEKQLQDLKKGKAIDLENGLQIKLSPNAENKNKLMANTGRLLIGSLILDGGISFAIIKTLQIIKSLLDDRRKQDIQNKYFNELQNLKGYLQQQAQRYPDDKTIINNINIVDKEIGSVNSIDASLNKKANYSEARLDLYDFDVSKDIQEKADRKKLEKQNEEKEKGFGFQR